MRPGTHAQYLALQVEHARLQRENESLRVQLDAARASQDRTARYAAAVVAKLHAKEDELARLFVGYTAKP